MQTLLRKTYYINTIKYKKTKQYEKANFISVNGYGLDSNIM